jgi:hypothetical protein
MSNVLASQSLAAAASVTSSAAAYVNNDVIICSCRIGATPPNQQCKVTLTGTIDGTNYVTLDSFAFGLAANQTYYHSFALGDYLGAGQFVNAHQLEALNSSSAAIWTFIKVTFAGNDTQAVTVAAVH